MAIEGIVEHIRILGETGGGEEMTRRLEDLSELSGAVGALMGSGENPPPIGGSVIEAVKAVATIDHGAAAPGLDRPPAEQ
eukprot:4090335-Pyramimonas_sp.AAC.1